MKKGLVLFIVFIFIGYPLFITAQELPEQYKEPFSKSFPIREKQHLELNAYLNKLIDLSKERDLTFFKPDFSNIKNYQNSILPYREKFLASLGYPPPGVKEGAVPKFVLIGEDSICKIYRVWLEVMDGVEAYGIYMVPKNLKGKAPLIISQHGGGGCPEAICDLDSRINYHSMGREAVKRGYIVWAPGLLFQVTYGGDPPIKGAYREILNRKAEFLGTGIIAIEMLKIIKSTEALVKNHPEIDQNRIGMAGLSWGGLYTLYVTAALPLIKVGVCSGYFNEQEAVLSRAIANLDSLRRPADNIFFNSFGNAQIVGLVCPRPFMVQMGKNDALFDLEGVRRETQKSALYYQKLGIGDRFKFFEHPAGHEFDIESLFAFLDKHLK